VDGVHEEEEDLPVHCGQFAQEGKHQGGKERRLWSTS
jgi:hypothetical protein